MIHVCGSDLPRDVDCVGANILGRPAPVTWLCRGASLRHRTGSLVGTNILRRPAPATWLCRGSSLPHRTGSQYQCLTVDICAVLIVSDDRELYCN